MNKDCAYPAKHSEGMPHNCFPDLPAPRYVSDAEAAYILSEPGLTDTESRLLATRAELLEFIEAVADSECACFTRGAGKCMAHHASSFAAKIRSGEVREGK